MVSTRPIDREYVPAGDSDFVAYCERLFRNSATGIVHFDPAGFERLLRHRYPYAAVVANRLSIGPGAAPAFEAAWSIFRDGGRSQSLW